MAAAGLATDLQLRDEAFLRGSTSWLSAQAIMPSD
jgi:hypothetical protein